MTTLTPAVVVRLIERHLRDHWSAGRIAREAMMPLAEVEALLEEHGGPDWRRNPRRLREEYARLTGQALERPAPGATIDRPAHVIRLALDALRPAHGNVRADLGDLDELAASLATAGQVAPLVVTPVRDRNGQFRIVDGHRRAAAAKQAGLPDLLCVVTGPRSAAKTSALMLAAAMHKQLEPLEQARAFQGLQQDGYSPGEISRLTGYSASTVRDRLSLLTLPREAQEMVSDGRLNVKDAVGLSRAPAAAKGAPLATTRKSAHLTGQHRLADQVREICASLDHRGARVFVGGVGCGQCWEHAIRTDEQGQP